MRLRKVEITKKQIEDSGKAREILSTKELPDDPELNLEQKQAIKLETRGVLPELAKKAKFEGRRKQSIKLTGQILDEEYRKEQIEKEELEKEELKKYQELQEKYETKDNEPNELFALRNEVISLLAQKERRKATELIVNYVEERNYIYTTRDDLKSEMWIYEEGIYIPQGKSYIIENCRKILRENYTTQVCNEVISKVEADTYIDIDEFFKSNLIYEIPVENGILNIQTRELLEFNPKKIFFNKLPIKYDSDAVCPNITKFFRSTLKHSDDTKVMFELFGYCLLKEYRYERAFMFVGNGRNGKSKTLTLLKMFLGAMNCCSIPLSQINPISSSVCELYGRLVNLAGDLSNTDLKDTGTIKQVTGRDLLNAKRKFLRDLIFVNYAKMVFACNELPRVYDMSEGFWSRWLLLEFPYKFIDEKEYELLEPEEKKMHKIRDEDIIENITSKEEMSGLLNMALESLKRLQDNHDFSYSKGTKEIKDMWIRQSDSFMAFCFDHVQENVDGHVTKRELRRFFSKYCKKHKISGAGDKGIKVTLENNYGVIETQLNNENRERVWEGIILIDLDKIM